MWCSRCRSASAFLTNERKGLPDSDGWVEAGFSQVIGKLTAQHSQHGTTHVRQSWQHAVLWWSRDHHYRMTFFGNEYCDFLLGFISNLLPSNTFRSHLLYAKSQYVFHVGWQQSEERVECPVVREVSHNDGQQWPWGDDGSPGDVAWWGGQLRQRRQIIQKLIMTFLAPFSVCRSSLVPQHCAGRCSN